jgi:RNA polymerase sigma-70 factor, ECF subfamily
LDFQSTVRPHLRGAYQLTRWLVRHPPDADDVFQEAILRAFRHFGSFSGERPRAWLFSIVRNACWSFLQRRPPEQPAFDEEQHSAGAPAADPETALASKAEAERIHRAVAALAPEYREAFILRELEGLSYKEIADVAGVPMGTVMSRLSRARRELQRQLGANDANAARERLT